MARRLPPDGEWPCHTTPLTDAQAPPRLVAFLYRLLRDGAAAPADVEEHAIQVGTHEAMPTFTNTHLELYARSLAAYLAPELATKPASLFERT